MAAKTKKTKAKTGKKTKAAFAKVLIIAAKSTIPGFASIKDFPWINKSFAVNRLLIPISKPPATIAGIIGTKISESNLTSCRSGFCFFELALFT